MRFVYGREEVTVTDEHTLINIQIYMPVSPLSHTLPHACVQTFRAGWAPCALVSDTAPEAKPRPFVYGSREPEVEPGPASVSEPLTRTSRVLSLKQDLGCHAGLPSPRLPAACLALPKGYA